MPVSHEIQVVSYSGRVAKRFSLSDWDGLEYDSVFNDIGTFALSLVGGPAQWVIDNLQLPRPALHFFVDVFRLDPMSRARERDRTFLYQYLEYGHDVDGVAFATLGGYDLNWLLLTRLVDVRLDPDETGGFLVLSGPASELMSRLVRYNGGDLTASIERMWPRFEVFADGTGFPAGGEYRFDVLLEVIQALALAGRVQFLIRHAGGGELQLHVGSLFQDRTVERNYPSRPYTLVSRKRRNIDEPTVIKDYREVRNYAYVRGSGNAGNEVFFEQAGLRDDDSPFGRVEFEVAVNRSSENDDPLTLLTETDTALSENGPIKQYEFAIKDRQGTRYKYDWDLGWIITGEYGGERRTVRVVGIEAEVDSEGEVISPILEDIGDTR